MGTVKLRVRHFLRGWWIVERKGWIFWRPVTRAFVRDTRRGSHPQHPLLFGSFNEAEEAARRLVAPGALEAHQREQDAVWADALRRYAKQEEGQDRCSIFEAGK